jgi:hypothetical protein
MSASNTIRKTTTITTITITSAWVAGILYTLYTTKNSRKNEFDTLFFSLEGLRNSFIIGGSIGFISSVLSVL